MGLRERLAQIEAEIEKDLENIFNRKSEKNTRDNDESEGVTISSWPVIVPCPIYKLNSEFNNYINKFLDIAESLSSKDEVEYVGNNFDINHNYTNFECVEVNGNRYIFFNGEFIEVMKQPEIDMIKKLIGYMRDCKA